MKVKIELGILLIIFLLSSYLIYNFVDSDTKNIVTNEEIRFKEENEKLNGVYNDKINHYYMNVNILENSNVKYKNANEIIDILRFTQFPSYLCKPAASDSSLTNTSYQESKASSVIYGAIASSLAVPPAISSSMASLSATALSFRL